MRKITDKEIHYFKTALGMCGLSVSNPVSEIILLCHSETKKMGGNFDLMTASKIQATVEEKYELLKTPPHITIKDMDDFYNKAVEIFHDKKREDELATKSILYELKTLIETKKQEFPK
jgi:hypothetical protein